MEIQDKYYKKYIKYKIKYLELQEKEGGGGFLSQTKSNNNKIRLYGDEYENVKKIVNNLKSINSIEIEKLLLNKLLDNIYNDREPDKIAHEAQLHYTKQIYKLICDTIICYNEYFYLYNLLKNDNDTIKILKKYYLDKIVELEFSTNKRATDYIVKFTKLIELKNIVKQYFKYIKNCINNNILINNIVSFENNNLKNIFNKEIEEEIKKELVIFSTINIEYIYSIQDNCKRKYILNNNLDINKLMLINLFFDTIILIKLNKSKRKKQFIFTYDIYTKLTSNVYINNNTFETNIINALYDINKYINEYEYIINRKDISELSKKSIKYNNNYYDLAKEDNCHNLLINIRDNLFNYIQNISSIREHLSNLKNNNK